MPRSVTRRAALKGMAATAVAAPFAFRHHLTAAPSETLYHASFGAGGMARSDIDALTRSPNLKLVAVADVDHAHLAALKKVDKFRDVRVYQDWRELLDKEKQLNSVNVSTPDHMHASIGMRCLKQGLHVYGQKPLTQTIYEARKLTEAAAAAKVVTQMGIQIHSHPVHQSVVATIHGGAIGLVREVYSWSGKHWGDKNPLPKREDKIPASLNWDHWLGVAAERPYLAGYYHPSEWRKRLDFGTGTFGDMGCHILDPVFSSLALTYPLSVRAESGAPNADNWGLDAEVTYIYPKTKYTTETLTLHWYDGDRRPPAAIKTLIGRDFPSQGSIYIGETGILFSEYIAAPKLLPAAKFADYKIPKVSGADHYLQFVDACRGQGQTTTPFSYAGPLTELVLIGCLATRFPKATLKWDAAKMQVTNLSEANAFVRRTYRKGWEVDGL